MRDLAGKTAFVTGGASGIGLAMGHAFAAAGARVMLADIEAKALDAAVPPKARHFVVHRRRCARCHEVRYWVRSSAASYFEECPEPACLARSCASRHLRDGRPSR